MPQDLTPPPSSEIKRRTVVKGAAWSVPVLAAAVGTPLAAATGDLTIEAPGSVLSGRCETVSDFTFTVKDANDGAAVGISVTVALPSTTLPEGSKFTWTDGTEAPRVFTSDVNGMVEVSGVVAPAYPGTYTVTASLAGGDPVTVPVIVGGANDVYIGKREGAYGGSGYFPVYNTTPVDYNNPGTPDFYGYCVEHDLGDIPMNWPGVLGSSSGYLGTDQFIPHLSYVRAVLANAFPYISIADFRTLVGQPTLDEKDAAELITWLIWNFTDYPTIDIVLNWPWTDPATQAPAYQALYDIAIEQAGTCEGDVRIVSSPADLCGTPTEGAHFQTFAILDSDFGCHG